MRVKRPLIRPNLVYQKVTINIQANENNNVILINLKYFFLSQFGIYFGFMPGHFKPDYDEKTFDVIDFLKHHI